MRHRSLGLGLGLAALALVVSACGSKVDVAKLTRASRVEVPAHPTLVAASPSSSPSPDAPPVVAVPPQAMTGPAPAAARPGRNAIAIIEIPKIGVRQPVFEGVSLAVLHYGPGHWPGTAMFGHLGNAVIAGHRITNTRPFFDIDLLSPGDLIFLTTDTDRFAYEMTEHFIVRPNETWIADDTPDAVLTFFGCHPKGSKSYRYVVRARLTTTPLPRSAAPSHASAQESLPDDGTSASPSTDSVSEPPPPPAPDEPAPEQCNSLLCRFGRRTA